MKPQIFPFTFGDEPLNSEETVSITCAVNKGDLPIKINWTLNNVPVEKVYGVKVNQMSSRASLLNIESITDEHSGEYKCIAENKAGIVEYATVLAVNGKQLISYKLL